VHGTDDHHEDFVACGHTTLTESSRSSTNNQGMEWEESWSSNHVKEATNIEPTKSMKRCHAPSRE